jgi:hypothetical protein
LAHPPRDDRPCAADPHHRAGVEEAFFNVLHIPFHLALCAALTLSLDPPRGPIGRIGYANLLFLTRSATPLRWCSCRCSRCAR